MTGKATKAEAPKEVTPVAEDTQEIKAPETTAVTVKKDAPIVNGNLINFDREQIDLIKKTIAVDATDNELKLFLYQAKRAGLDPLASQIHLVKRSGKMTIQTGIDGFRIVADRSGNYAGQDAPEYVYPKVAQTTTAQKLIPFKALVKVYKFSNSGERYLAAVGEAFWAEFKPSGSQAFMWEKMPHTMLAKCAEAQALRKAFPNDLSGIYTTDEMQQADTQAPPSKPLADDTQRKRIFALTAELGYDGDEAKNIVKTHFKLASFNDLTKNQAISLINTLVKKLDAKKEAEALEMQTSAVQGQADELPEDIDQAIDGEQVADDVFNALG